jgi:phage recombination protein Bet
MTSTESPRSTDLATRSSAPQRAAAQQSAALALRAGQTMWDKNQHAALVAMGIPKEASSAELGVFLHQCQRTGLDPFARQIYLIYRPSNENGKFVSKPTTQTGIDGYRLIRDRIAKRDGVRVEYEDTVWYTADGQALGVWLWDEPPAACTVAIKVDGRRFSSTLRFNEYCQRKKDGNLNKMWTEKPAHMIEKCCEADVLRRAFPQDLSGLLLEDVAPLAEDAPPAPQRATAEQIRTRKPQPVASEVVPQEPESAEEQWPAWVTEGIRKQALRLIMDPGEVSEAARLLLPDGTPAADLTGILAAFENRGDLIAALAAAAADGEVPGDA